MEEEIKSDQDYREYIELIKREASLTALLEVQSLVYGDGSLTASDKSDFGKHITGAYKKLTQKINS